jgi:hypothetical protein
MLLRRLKYPRTPGLIIRRTHPELYKSHIVKMFEEYPGIREWWNEQRKELTFPNGSRLFFGSAEHSGDMSAFYSAEFADIMPDEAQEFSQGELEQLTGSNRCTSNGDIVPKMIHTFMPGMSESGVPPKGLPYLKRVYVDKQLRGPENNRKWAFIQAFSWDNIEWARNELARDGVSESEFYSWDNETRREYFITRTDYGANLAAITNKYLREAWLLGKWDTFEGQYFPNFDYTKHVIDAAELKDILKPWHKRWISCDWGFDHPLCVHWHAQTERGDTYTYRELWGREIGETELGRRIGELSKGEKISAFPLSWDAFGKLNPKTRKSITQMISDALPMEIPRPRPADSAPGTRINGWRLLYQLFDSGKYFVSSDCERLIEQIPTLIRDPESPEDVLKVDFSENHIGDDAADCARYGLADMLTAPQKPREVVRAEMLESYDGNIDRIRKLRESGFGAATQGS